MTGNDKEKIHIEKCTDGDTRTAKFVPSISEFEIANRLHIHDVADLTGYLSYLIVKRGYEHDWTKVKDPYQTMFYRDMIKTIEEHQVFTDGEWYKAHVENERHHLDSHVPDDVNLIDVLEMLCDNVAAGLARTGEVREFEIDSDVLQLAVKNTITLLENKCENPWK